MNIPVLIVGGGPTGLSCSILLSRLGVRSMLVERHPSTSIFPKATGISTRTMELFRAWGVEGRVREFSRDIKLQNSVRRTLSSTELERRSLGFPEQDALDELSPAWPAICPQDYLEPLLLAHAKSFAYADVRYGNELVALIQDSEGVSAAVRTRGTGREIVVNARYVIAADGASSPTRRQLGIEMQGTGPARDYLTILFRANLEPFVGARRSALYSIVHPDINGAIVPTSTTDRWVLGMPCDPKSDPDISRDIDGLVARVRTATGVNDLAVEIVSASTFAMAAQIADRFRDGRVFLAGDAAHRMRPAGGLGMNTGIHDAHNLAWKIAAVLQGWAGEELLTTYESERRVVAQRNVAKSTGAFHGVSNVSLDLGPVYASPAIVPFADEHRDFEEPTVPAGPGRRAPHLWLQHKGQRVSTLDLFDNQLVMLAGPDGAWWCHAAEQVADVLGVAIETLVLDKDVVGAGATTMWQSHFAATADGAVIVRPDGHIAWCSPTWGERSNVAAILPDVFSQILARTDHMHHDWRKCAHESALTPRRRSA